MWIGLLWSRALLSMGMAAFVLFALITQGAEGLREWRASRWLQGLTLLFLVPLLSGAWSADQASWLALMQVKVPLLLFPFCVPQFRLLDRPLRIMLLWVLMALLMAAMLQSLWWYEGDAGREYLKGKVMRVPMYDDHVRFGWLLVVGYAWLLDYGFRGYLKRPVWAVVMGSVLAVYMHVLASKTGLLGCYLVSLVYLIRYARPRWRWLGLAALVVLPVLAWFTIPAFQERLRFVVWDFQNYSRGNYVEGLNDAPRLLSWRAAVEIIRDAPLAGVGMGDARAAAQAWYAAHAPFLKPYEQLLPASQFLLYGVYAGIIGCLAACWVLLMPLWMPGLRRDTWWWAFHLVAIAGFVYEIALEMQFGVFIYSFFALLIFAEAEKRS